MSVVLPDDDDKKDAEPPRDLYKAVKEFLRVCFASEQVPPLDSQQD